MYRPTDITISLGFQELLSQKEKLKKPSKDEKRLFPCTILNRKLVNLDPISKELALRVKTRPLSAIQPMAEAASILVFYVEQLNKL